MHMSYQMMKALMDASRQESEVQHNPELEEIPGPDSVPEWKYLDYVAKMAA
jgi:hypothetical protein